ncbi:hypothetical protein GJV26_15255 [Massilia dura]|uniref:PEP-CTERM sorting domain-containing protein n=1 Tax=Pseudoduganella dura TaxID=321982 RepID=A0A6I3XGX2_9BURK|nr:hypothetical protein [Pseudoduganella dura]MUI13800.1 hypothetical protein [Pseudoduganella dura]GGY11001.1 hypothetical protein GCM10007386_46670 [Pseudoduganella dura]
MRSTPVVALAALLACLPARAVDVIDLHDLHHARGHAALMRDYMPRHMPGPISGHIAGHTPAILSGYRIDRGTGNRTDIGIGYGIDNGPGDDPAGFPAELAPGVPLPPGSWPAGLHAAPAPVPEPMSVLMLACGLLLIMPGAWAARWSRLGDDESLLQRRLP